MGDDGFMKNDGRLPLYMRRVFEAYKATRLEVERKKGRVDLKITQVEGLAPDTAMSEEQFAESKDDGVAYWMFTNPVAAYIWYAYFKSEEGSKILTTLSHMVLTTEALLQLMGSCRRRIIKKDALAVLEERFEKGRSAYKDALAQADATWGAELEAMAQVILPEAPEVPAEDTDNK
jgi:cystathionine beta-lyase/cystathionine gamma-synthase